MSTKFYREAEFCYESLGMPYSEFKKLPRWEKILINTFLDVKQSKQQQEDDYWEQRRQATPKVKGGLRKVAFGC